MTSDITVVVPSAGQAEVLERTLRALRRAAECSAVTVARLIVVDDRGGRPEVRRVAEDAGADTVAVSSLGPGGARNAGARLARSAWLLFMDDDIELAPVSLQPLQRLDADGAPDALVGALTAPADGSAPRWLVDAYARGVVAPSAAGVTRRTSDGTRVTSALLVVRRSLFEAAGGFPENARWGWEDLLLGLSMQAHVRSSGWLALEPGLQGTHHYLPTWRQWVDRQQRAGALLVPTLQQLDDAQRLQVLRAVSLRGTPKASVKRLLGLLPLGVWLPLEGRWAPGVAAAAAFAHGYRGATRGE